MSFRLAVAAALAFAALASSAAAAGRIGWSVVAHGTTLPSGSQFAVGYAATTRAGERAFSTRLDATARTALTRVDLGRNVAVAVFLDGAPCATRLAVSRLTRAAAVLTVHLDFTRPPVGMATCVRTSTPYVVLAVPRASLGPAPVHRVAIDAVPRP